MKGKSIVDNDSKIGSSCASTSKDDDNSKDRKRNALFHRRVMRDLHARIVKSKDMKRQSVGSYILK